MWTSDVHAASSQNSCQRRWHDMRGEAAAHEALSSVTLALGGRAGARLARKLDCWSAARQCSGRFASDARPSASSAPRVLGIDEWAWKKGHRYGTILCDLEQRRVIDLLPNRRGDGRSMAASASERAGGQPGPGEFLRRCYCEGRAGSSAGGRSLALVETLGRSLERHRPTIVNVFKRVNRNCASRPPFAEELPTQAVQRTRQNRERRLARYREFRSLVDAGMNYSEASRQMGLGLRTLQRWVACGVFPERKHRVYPSIVDAYGAYLEKRYGEGCGKITQLWQELKERRLRRTSFDGSKLAAAALRVTQEGAGKSTCEEIASCFAPAHRYLKALLRASPEIAALAHTARGLFDIIRTRDATAWPGWLEAAERSPYAPFARLRRDQDAIAAALQLPWSNGMVEGQIHRLKLTQVPRRPSSASTSSGCASFIRPKLEG